MPWTQEQLETNTVNQSSRLRVISNINGYSTVFVPGKQPFFLLKSAASTPKLLKLRGDAIAGASGFHTKSCANGWIYFDFEVGLLG